MRGGRLWLRLYGEAVNRDRVLMAKPCNQSALPLR
jgi:hypothetical protein